MMKTRVILFLVSFCVWLLLHWSVQPQDLLVGALVAIFVAAATSDVFEREERPSRSVTRYLWFFVYVPVFIWECIKANIDGAYRVIHPRLPCNPGIVKVRTTLTSETALTMLANSLTLKPGTMTVDIDREQGVLYVHWIDVKDRDIEKATQMIVSRFERILKRIFET